MPELPEVETVRRGIEPHIVGHLFEKINVYNDSLRYPVTPGLTRILAGQLVLSVQRRAKYLIIAVDKGSLIIHLGMSGSLRLVKKEEVLGKHDHVDMMLSGTMSLRFNDPRRFGLVLWITGDPMSHRLFCRLGPEPLSAIFDGAYLYAQSRQRRCSIKAFIMDQCVVVGVGNIYACEALFQARISPKRLAGNVSHARYVVLVAVIQSILKEAIRQGGTTIQDFVDSRGKPGYFQQKLQVYQRTGQDCSSCQRAIKRIKQAQRSTFYCAHCQR